jgi:hypothetical protein
MVVWNNAISEIIDLRWTIINQGNMHKSIYDKHWVNDDAFEMDNMIQSVDWLHMFVTQSQIDLWNSYQNTKQDLLVSWDNIKTINNISVLWNWNIDTNQVSNNSYSDSWSWVNDIAPSKNAVYNKFENVNSDITNLWNNIQSINSDIEDIDYNISDIVSNVDDINNTVQWLSSSIDNKQNKLTAWQNIQINWDTISAIDTKYTAWTWLSLNNTTLNNTWVLSVNNQNWNVTVSEFTPSNTGNAWQVLKKTSNGYEWGVGVGAVTSVNWQTGAVTVNEFTPRNQWNTWQVLKKTSSWYNWQDESWWGGWGLWNSGINTFVLEDPTDPTELANLFTWTESWIYNEPPEVWVIISYWLLFYFARSTTAVDYYYCPDADILMKVNVEMSGGNRVGISSVVVCEWFHYWEFWTQSDFSDIASVWVLISNWLTDTEQDTDDFIPARIRVWSDAIYERNWMPVENSGNFEITFMCTDSTSAYSASWTSRTYHKLIIFTFSYSSGIWTYVSSTTNQVRIITPYVLRTDYNYANPYTPLYNGSPATKKYVDDNVAYVWSSAPTNPTEWRLWYDTTNDVLKTYDGSSWNEVWGGWSWEWNTKTFYLSDASDLTTAQEAYDRWISGKEPIIYILNASPYTNSWPLFVKSWTRKNATTVYFEWTTISKYDDSSTWKSWSYVIMCYFSISNWTVSSVYWPTSTYKTSMFLATWVNYSTPYTPQYDGSPATKKYVDDSVSVVSGDSWVTYTIKVSNSDPASWTANNIITLVI